MGARPDCRMSPLTMMLVDVLIRVTELEMIEANASGISSLVGLVEVRQRFL
jgi:hypothetical protein